MRLREKSSEPQKGKSHLNQKKIAKIDAHKKKHKERLGDPAQRAAASQNAEGHEGESKHAADDNIKSAAAHAAARLGIDEGAAALLLAEMKGASGTSSDGASLDDIDLDTITATQLRRVANPCANLFSHGEFESIDEIFSICILNTDPVCPTPSILTIFQAS